MDRKEVAWQEDLKKIQQELDSDSIRWNIDGIAVTATGIHDITEDEARKYVKHVLERVPDPVTWIRIQPAKKKKDSLELYYEYHTVKFERIRRITGYLVGTIDRWNNAKKSEESERVKHL